MRLLACLLPLPIALTACVRPAALDPPGLAIGLFRAEQDTNPPAQTLRGVGLIAQPGRVRLGYIRERRIRLPGGHRAHLRGRELEIWYRPEVDPAPRHRPSPVHLHKEPDDD